MGFRDRARWLCAYCCAVPCVFPLALCVCVQALPPRVSRRGASLPQEAHSKSRKDGLKNSVKPAGGAWRKFHVGVCSSCSRYLRARARRERESKRERIRGTLDHATPLRAVLFQEVAAKQSPPSHAPCGMELCAWARSAGDALEALGLLSRGLARRPVHAAVGVGAAPLELLR